MAFKRPEKKTYSEESLYEYAVGALGRRMRSVAELKRLMRPRVGHQEDANRLMDAVVERLKQQKYLNDARYAESFSNYRKENEKFGRNRVVNELRTRGVHADVIDKAVNTTYGETDEVELAKKFIQRKRVRPPADQKATGRVFRMLLRAGFGSRTAYRVLNGMKADTEVLSVLESEAAEIPDNPENE
ncbi:MAG TPA: regulatory protein RecX [Candidatus Koribacter sp.]